jgi:hypothetical protein
MQGDEFAPTVIGYFDVGSHEADLQAFEQVAQEEGGKYRFGVVSDNDLLEELKMSGCVVYVHKAVR